MPAVRIASALESLGRLTPPVAAAYVYSHFFVDHHVPLRSALEAERHAIQTTDAGTISFYADTSAGGRPVVLVHGPHAAASAYDMRPLFDKFRKERPVYALDLPGFGFSQRGARAYRPLIYVHAIEHLLRQVTTRQGADVIALSLSAEFAAQVAVEMPELVRSLVLISPTGFSSDRQMSAFERRARRGEHRERPLQRMLGEQIMYDVLVSKPSLRYFLNRSFFGPIDEPLLTYAFVTSHQPDARFAPLAFVRGETFPQGHPRKAYEHVRAQTLVLYDQDPYTGFGELASFVQMHRNFRAVRIAPTRGMPQFEARQQTAEAIRAFWQGCDERAHVLFPQATRFVGSA